MTIGEKLRQAREAQSITLHEIAEKTNISVRSLDALEKGQTDKLPGGIFTRGFVRSYAAHVGLDPDDVVREYVAAHPEVRTPEEQEEMEPPRSQLPLVLGLIALLALVLAGGYWWMNRPVPPQAVQSTTGYASAASVPTAGATASPAGAVGQASPTTSAGQASPTTGTVTPSAADEPVEPPTSAASDPPVANEHPLQVTLVPTGRCWVRVRADGEVRVSRELAAGDRVDVAASEVIEILAGDAGAFAYRLNGAPGRALGTAGNVGRATITADNVAEFQAAP